MSGEIFHVFNRGVEKRKVFLDEQDYLRFVNNLFLLNNKSGKIRTEKKDIFSGTNLKQEKLVEVLKWSLLPNHYHLLLYEVEEGGVLEFVKRIGNAYTKYFNIKNKGRSGYLFQNSAKIVSIERDPQFIYIPFYIDLNPLDLKFLNWKKVGVDNKEALSFLKKYKWSSFTDYYGNGRDSIINKDLFFDLFESNNKDYEKGLSDFLNDNS
ncbi:MAG TPA: transposase [Candidatus Paceibacterota bacterium]